MERSPFEILGLADSATLEEVELAWKRLASETHPDRGGDADKFMACRAAYLQARAEVAEPKRCDECRGTGKITVSHGFSSMTITCNICNGSGFV
jgi:DnaJ-class molecular chaperone